MNNLVVDTPPAGSRIRTNAFLIPFHWSSIIRNMRLIPLYQDIDYQHICFGYPFIRPLVMKNICVVPPPPGPSVIKSINIRYPSTRPSLMRNMFWIQQNQAIDYQHSRFGYTFASPLVQQRLFFDTPPQGHQL
jgi:hypothetical protein